MNTRTTRQAVLTRALVVLAAATLAAAPSPASAKAGLDRVAAELVPPADQATPALRAVGPVVYAGHRFDDDVSGNSHGDSDGIWEAGEVAEMYIDLGNDGTQTATSVNATIGWDSPYVTALFNTASNYGDIVPFGVATNTDDFDFHLDPATPDGHVITFDLSITASNSPAWADTFAVTVYNNLPTVALISDLSELLPLQGLLRENDFQPTVLNTNWDGVNGTYTSHLGVLMTFDVVVWYGSGTGSGRLTTQAEFDALETYVQAGGRLLVTGYDTLGHPDDPLLADLVRSTSVGDDPVNSLYTVTDDIHPIMNGPYASLLGGAPVMAANADHDSLDADRPRGALTIAEFGNGNDKIIATDLGPAPGTGRIVYWNGNYNAMDWIGPPPVPMSRIAIEDKPLAGRLSNETLRGLATPVVAADLQGTANTRTDGGLRLGPDVLSTLRPARTGGLRTTWANIFPSSSAVFSVAGDPYWWNAGDYCEETFYLPVDVLDRASYNLVISQNLLSGAGYVDLALVINGTPVTSFRLGPGDMFVAIPAIAFPAITGNPGFTVRLEAQNTVPTGLGSVWIDPDLSTLTLANDQQSIFLNTMTWLASGASRWDPNEPNDNPGVCAPLQYGVPVVDAGIDPPGDWDWFCFWGNAGEIIELDVDGGQIGSSLDPVMELWSPAVTFLAMDDDTHGVDPYLTWAVTETGTHYVRVRSWAHPCCGGPSHFYTLRVDVIGATDAPAVVAGVPPAATGIERIAPSPTRGSTSISFGVAHPARVRLSVHDVAGRRIRSLSEDVREAGRHVLVWDGRNDRGSSVASGVYFVSMQVDQERWTKRMTVLR